MVSDDDDLSVWDYSTGLIIVIVTVSIIVFMANNIIQDALQRHREMKMRTLPVRSLDITMSLNWKEDLVYYDGPIVAVVESGGSLYIFSWFDFDNQYNRWLLIPIDDNLLEQYKKGKVSLLWLIEQHPVLKMVDINNEIAIVHVYEIDRKDISPSLLPTADSFYDPTYKE